MTQCYSSGPQSPVVPVIGPNVLNLMAFRRGPSENVRSEHPRARHQHVRPREVIDYFAAAFIIMAVAFGPAVAWLLVK